MLELPLSETVQILPPPIETPLDPAAAGNDQRRIFKSEAVRKIDGTSDKVPHLTISEGSEQTSKPSANEDELYIQSLARQSRFRTFAGAAGLAMLASYLIAKHLEKRNAPDSTTNGASGAASRGLFGSWFRFLFSRDITSQPGLSAIEKTADGIRYYAGEHAHRKGKCIAAGTSRVRVQECEADIKAYEKARVTIEGGSAGEVCASARSRIVARSDKLIRASNNAIVMQYGNGTAHAHDDSRVVSRGNGTLIATDHAIVKKFGGGDVSLTDSAVLLAHQGSGDLTMRDFTSGKTETKGAVILNGKASVEQRGSGNLTASENSRATTYTSGKVHVKDSATATHRGSGPLLVEDQGNVEIYGGGDVEARGNAKCMVDMHGSGRLTVGNEAHARVRKCKSITVGDTSNVHYFGRNVVPIKVSGSSTLSASYEGSIKAQGTDPTKPATINLHEEFKGTASVGDNTRTRASGAGVIHATGDASIQLERSFHGTVQAHGTEKMTILAAGRGEIVIRGKGTVILDANFSGTVRASGDVVIKSCASRATIFADGNCRIEHKGDDRRCKIVTKGGCKLRIEGDAEVHVSGKGSVVEYASGQAKITVSDEAKIADANGSVEIERKAKGVVSRARGDVKIVADFDFAGVNLYDTAELYVPEDGVLKLKRRATQPYREVSTPDRIGPDDRLPNTDRGGASGSTDDSGRGGGGGGGGDGGSGGGTRDSGRSDPFKPRRGEERSINPFDTSERAASTLEGGFSFNDSRTLHETTPAGECKAARGTRQLDQSERNQFKEYCTKLKEHADKETQRRAHAIIEELSKEKPDKHLIAQLRSKASEIARELARMKATDLKHPGDSHGGGHSVRLSVAVSLLMVVYVGWQLQKGPAPPPRKASIGSR